MVRVVPRQCKFSSYSQRPPSLVFIRSGGSFSGRKAAEAWSLPLLSIQCRGQEWWSCISTPNCLQGIALNWLNTLHYRSSLLCTPVSYTTAPPCYYTTVSYTTAPPYYVTLSPTLPLLSTMRLCLLHYRPSLLLQLSPTLPPLPTIVALSPTLPPLPYIVPVSYTTAAANYCISYLLHYRPSLLLYLSLALPLLLTIVPVSCTISPPYYGIWLLHYRPSLLRKPPVHNHVSSATSQ
jgi:hypothetical protein